MSAELYYWEKGELYSQSYPAVRLEGSELMVFGEDGWQPHLTYDIVGGWTRWEDDVPLSDLGIGTPPGQRQHKGQVDLLLVDSRGLVLARRPCEKLLSLFRQGSRLTLHLSLSTDGREVLPLARLERGAAEWAALEHWQEAAGSRGQVIVAAPGLGIPGLYSQLNMAEIGPRSRLSGLAL